MSHLHLGGGEADAGKTSGRGVVAAVGVSRRGVVAGVRVRRLRLADALGVVSLGRGHAARLAGGDVEGRVAAVQHLELLQRL